MSIFNIATPVFKMYPPICFCMGAKIQTQEYSVAVFVIGRLETAYMSVSVELIEQFIYDNDSWLLCACEENLFCAGTELFPRDVDYYNCCSNLKR